VAQPFEIITEDTELSEAVRSIQAGEKHELVLAELGGGLLRFVGVAFPEADVCTQVLAQKYVREPEGRGPHFDVYNGLLDDKYPYVALYNLSGTAQVAATELSAELAAVYFKEFINHTDEAAVARRHLGALALSSPNSIVFEAEIGPGHGFVLPQYEQGPHIVHDIVPTDPTKPGEFIKFVVSNGSKEATEKLFKNGYKPLDAFVTETLGGVIAVPKNTEKSQTYEVPDYQLPGDLSDVRLDAAEPTQPETPAPLPSTQIIPRARPRRPGTFASPRFRPAGSRKLD
jgi:hypothetical protein